jgi:hypothetical protein
LTLEILLQTGNYLGMSRKNSDPSRERRARRQATRLGLHLMISQKPDKQVLAHGGYMLRDGKTMQIVFGNAEYLFSASLDEIETKLDALDAS